MEIYTTFQLRKTYSCCKMILTTSIFNWMKSYFHCKLYNDKKIKRITINKNQTLSSSQGKLINVVHSNLYLQIFHDIIPTFYIQYRGRHGHDCMVVGFTTTFAISTYHY